MVVGLGTGRAASRAIKTLGARCASGVMSVTCVSTSDVSTTLARSVGLTVLDMAGIAEVDVLFDGADEVDPELRMLKGRGGAMTREKVVARASRRRIYLVQSSKIVKRIGERCALPVEVMAFAMASVRNQLAKAGLSGEVRRAEQGIYRTDNGHPVLDLNLPAGVDSAEVGAMLDGMAGVIDHGLFLHEADIVLVEDDAAEAGGPIRRLERRHN